jgi:hypothetical protein
MLLLDKEVRGVADLTEFSKYLLDPAPPRTPALKKMTSAFFV